MIAWPNWLRLRISPSRFVYLDLSVICSEPAFAQEDVDTITNPKVIAEILSPSTEDDDRWILTPYEGLAAVARLESLNISIPLAEIYPTA